MISSSMPSLSSKSDFRTSKGRIRCKTIILDEGTHSGIGELVSFYCLRQCYHCSSNQCREFPCLELFWITINQPLEAFAKLIPSSDLADGVAAALLGATWPPQHSLKHRHVCFLLKE